MKNILVVFIIALTILSGIIPLNTVYAQEVIGEIPDDPFGDSDIIIEKWILIWVIFLHGLIIVLIIIIIIIRKKLTLYRHPDDE